jgi:hypothetical protein
MNLYMNGLAYLTCRMSIMQVSQIIRHGYKQFVCETLGHDVSHVKARYINDKQPEVRCERCGIPLRLSYTSDGKRIKINEIFV